MKLCGAQISHLQILRDTVREDLLGNILPFWFRLEQKDGFLGGLTDDLRPIKDSPIALVMITRLMWTYSRAYRMTGDTAHIEFAGRVYDYLLENFADRKAGGFVWWLDSSGNVLESKKQTYGQAFAVYAFSEYYLAKGDQSALDQANDLFQLMEKHCWKDGCGGYWEASDQFWNPMKDVRLSEKDMNAPISMNTHLHVMEGYTNLLLAAGNQTVSDAGRKVLDVVINRILCQNEPRLGLFFDDKWNLLTNDISPGHDIEASWLIWETAEILGDKELLSKIRPLVLGMVDFVMENGADSNGSILNEYAPGKPKSKDRDWWPQAEGVVGFLNAFQMTGQQDYLEASLKTWEYIREFIIDPVHGEWIAGRTVNGELQNIEKAGPWKSAYHNGRMGFEVIKRINDILKD